MRIKQGWGAFSIIVLLFLSLSPVAYSQGAARLRTVAVLEFDGVGVPDQIMQDVSERFANEYANFFWLAKEAYPTSNGTRTLSSVTKG